MVKRVSEFALRIDLMTRLFSHIKNPPSTTANRIHCADRLKGAGRKRKRLLLAHANRMFFLAFSKVACLE